mgnify:CR=1 FL=1
MSYIYYKFENNRSVDDAKKIFLQRIEDAKFIYNKYQDSFEKRNCPYCGGISFEFFDKFHDTYEIVRCKSCNNPFVNPAPNVVALVDYYENCFCNRQLTKVISNRFDKNDFINDDRIKVLIKVIKGLIDHKDAKTINILEVGSNNGAFLSRLKFAVKETFPDTTFNLTGVDVDSTSINNSLDSDLNLIHGSAEDIASEHSELYDIIMHFELLEHLNDPRSFASAVYSMLNIGGKMIFTTPNVSGFDNQALGFNNMRFLAHGLFPPMHLNAFSVTNIPHFLLSLGFDIESVKTPGRFDVDIVKLCQEYLEEDIFHEFSELKVKDRALMQQIFVRLGVSSHMQVIASKNYSKPITL